MRVGETSLCMKTNPPYPPLTGGYEKATPRQGGIKKEGPMEEEVPTKEKNDQLPF